jgi:hypothetical protein
MSRDPFFLIAGSCPALATELSLENFRCLRYRRIMLLTHSPVKLILGQRIQSFYLVSYTANATVRYSPEKRGLCGIIMCHSGPVVALSILRLTTKVRVRLFI